MNSELKVPIMTFSRERAGVTTSLALDFNNVQECCMMTVRSSAVKSYNEYERSFTTWWLMGDQHRIVYTIHTYTHLPVLKYDTS